MGPFKAVNSFLLVFSAIVHSGCSDEVFIQVNLKRPVNYVSDKYVSFSIDPEVLLENINATDSDVSDFMAKQLKPSYLKIAGNSFFKLLSALSNGEQVEELQDNVPQIVWMNFNQWIRSVDWLPIVPLPYNPKKWDSIHALKVLNISNSLGVKDCIWQLGIDFDPTDAPRYVDDLTTLKNVVGAFDDVPNHWGVVGADISSGSNHDETRLYIDLAQDVVEAIGWIQPSEYLTFERQNHMIDDRDLALRAILSRNLPAWLSVPPKMLKNTKNAQNCSALCITEGLQWAQTLGDAARTGFSVVFKPLDKSDIIEPGFSFYISWLFKKTMGEEVFDTRMISGDRYISHFYSHCTKDVSGAVTIMGINMGDVSSKITAKLTYRYSGPELWQYVLTVTDGVVKLNGERVSINATFEPLVKVKHPSKPMTLVLPPLSIGFWILPSANVRECLREDLPELRLRLFAGEEERSERLMTSSDRLLQQLIKENIAATSSPPSNRLKRHIVVKKDSNYLNQLTKDVDRRTYDQYAKPSELIRQKRFILQNKNRPRLFQHIFDRAGLGAANEVNSLGGFGLRHPLAAPLSPPPTPPPPPPPPPVETPVDDNRRFKRVFPRLPFMKLEQLFNPRKIRRARRQAINFFKLGPFAAGRNENKPKLFPGLRKIVGPQIPGALESSQPNEEALLAPRKDIHFPEGDVHVNITKIPDADYDYVEFDTGSNSERKRKPAVAQDNGAFKRISNQETYTLTDIVPRVEKPFIPPPRQMDDQDPEASIDNMQLQKAREQLETYYMPSEPSGESMPTKVKLKSGSEEETEAVVQTRKRRNAFLRSLSYALSQGDQHLTNLIERENSDPSNSIPVFNRVVPYLRLQEYDRSAKPLSLEEIQNEATERMENAVLEEEEVTTTPYDPEAGDGESDVARIRIIAEGPASNPHTPKFMQYLTTKLNSFMDMINNHVSGWWSTWV